LQHLHIAIRISERENRVTPDKTIDADRLARTIIDEFDFRQLEQLCSAVRFELKFRDAR